MYLFFILFAVISCKTEVTTVVSQGTDEIKEVAAEAVNDVKDQQMITAAAETEVSTDTKETSADESSTTKSEAKPQTRTEGTTITVEPKEQVILDIVKDEKKTQSTSVVEAQKTEVVTNNESAVNVVENPSTQVPVNNQSEIPVQKEIIKEKEMTEAVVGIDHGDWDQLLRTYVSAAGKVDYKGLKKNVKKLDAYLAKLANQKESDLTSRSAKMAYWINAYNAFTIKLIVDNYPVSSIRDLEGGSPWDKKWIKVNGETLSLNNIEHDILRKKYSDARIHFAVNCAAVSCPKVLNRAWTADNLERNFEKMTKQFVNNAVANTLSNDNIQLSKIFEWYAVDFPSLIPFLNKYADVKISPNAVVRYKDYNWSLNE